MSGPCRRMHIMDISDINNIDMRVDLTNARMKNAKAVVCNTTLT
jgi:hypothetical protein